MQKDKITIVHKVIFAGLIMEHFLACCDGLIEGIASDFAKFDVLLGAEKYLKKPNKKFEEYLEFTLGIKKSDLAKIKKIYGQKVKDIEKLPVIF